MIQETFYTIILIFYGWILFLEFITLLLGDAFLVLVMYGVMSLYETGLYYLRHTNKKKHSFYSGVIFLLVSIDIFFHLFCWLLLNPLRSNLSEMAVMPLMILSDLTRLYYEFIFAPSGGGGGGGGGGETEQKDDFSILIGT